VINRLPFVVVEWPRSTQDLVRISIDRVETNFVIDIRSWGRDSNGVLKPGPQGLMLSVRHLPKLVSGFKHALQIADEWGLVAGATRRKAPRARRWHTPTHG
jgi:hypothetical protein